MPIVEDHIIIKANQEYLFNLSQDYSKRLDWDPYLAKAEILGVSKVIKPGTQVYCESKKGIGMTVEYVTFKPPNFTAIKLTKDFLIFDNFAGSWRFKAINDQETKVVFRYNFKLKSWVGFIEPLIKQILKIDLKKRLEGLKYYVETI